MSLISTLPDRICEWFSDLNSFSDCSFCTQFPSSSKTTPLSKPVIVFGTKEIVVLDNTTDETGSVITDSRIAESTFKIGIHVPRASGGSECYSILDRLMDLLLFDSTLSISEIKSSDVDYIRNTDSLYMYATFKTSETLRKGASYPAKFTI